MHLKKYYHLYEIQTQSYINLSKTIPPAMFMSCSILQNYVLFKHSTDPCEVNVCSHLHHTLQENRFSESR